MGANRQIAATPDWPEWWEWELDASNPHLREQMARRRFNEIDLRDMLERATGVRFDQESERWVASTKFDGDDWEVILEPDDRRLRLVVVTAYDVY